MSVRTKKLHPDEYSEARKEALQEIGADIEELKKEAEKMSEETPKVKKSEMQALATEVIDWVNNNPKLNTLSNAQKRSVLQIVRASWKEEKVEEKVEEVQG